jgi:hypothetical protein
MSLLANESEIIHKYIAEYATRQIRLGEGIMSKNWKENLFRSGLPFEQVVAEKLTRMGFFVVGEFAYLRQDTNREEKEFSVDIDAWRLIPSDKDSWGHLKLLIECKYRHDGVIWLFGRQPNTEIMRIGAVNVFEELCTRTVSHDILSKWESKLTECVLATELTPDGNNPYDIEHGASQLRYASIQRSYDILRDQAEQRHDSELWIEMTCPFLLTTARLFVLNKGLVLQGVHDARSLEDVASEVPCVIYHKDAGPSLRSHARRLRERLYKYAPNLESRFQTLHSIRSTEHAWMKEGLEKLSVETLLNIYVGSDIMEAGDKVIVVNFDAFEEKIAGLWRAVKKTGHSIRTIAKLRFDISDGRTWIEQETGKQASGS